MKHDPVPILSHAIAVEGTALRLAEVMKVAPSTVTRWKSRGLPLHVANDLVKRYGRRKVPKSPLDWKPSR